MRSVQELRAAGVAGLTIEDTLLPRPYGASKLPGLVSLEEGVGKMRAALHARDKAAGDGAILVFGRTSAAAITGVDDATRRLLAYQDAGVDALFVPGLKERAELDAIAAAVQLPIILGGCHGRLADPAYLTARNVKVWLPGHQAFAAADPGRSCDAHRCQGWAAAEPLEGHRPGATDVQAHPRKRFRSFDAGVPRPAEVTGRLVPARPA